MFEAPSSEPNISAGSPRRHAGTMSGYYNRIAAGRLGGGFTFRVADLDRVVDRVLAPLEPAAVIDRDPIPALEIGVEPRLAGPPARPAVERDPLVRRDPGLRPVGCDLR